jgi:cytochrome c oxidase assembly protein subunit 15
LSTPSSTATDSATESATSPGGPPRFIDADGLPSRLVRVLAWISFVLNVTIIATGGAVRLTGSGLGCSDWPVCVPGSLTPTPELGIHGVIEFGNRTLSGPLLIFAIAVLVLTWTIRRQRRDLFVISAVVLGLVASQAVIGGFVVWLHLNANLVGVHYVISLIIVCVTAAYLVRMYERPGARERAVPTPFLILAHITTFAMAITVFVGVLTTGAGPHSGDDSVVRVGVDAALLAHVHPRPVALVIWALAQRLRPRAWSVALLVVLLVQIGVGVYQARSGLPPLAVGVHMVLASLTAAAMTVVVLRLKRPVAA